MRINGKGYIASVIFLVVFAVVFLWKVKGNQLLYQHNEGLIFGTVYHITYQYSEDLQSEMQTNFLLARMKFSSLYILKGSELKRMEKKLT